MTYVFAGQIFQFVARPDNVDNYGFNFTMRHPLNLWKAQNDTSEYLVLRPKCIGPKLFKAEVGIGSKYYWGRSVPWAKMCLGLIFQWKTKFILGILCSNPYFKHFI